MDARQLLCEALVACTRGIMGEGGGDCSGNKHCGFVYFGKMLVPCSGKNY